MKFKAILSDPPWLYTRNRKGKNGQVETHYKPMTPEDIANIPVHTWAEPDCFLFLWATFPKLEDAFFVLNAWGFEYITAIPWIKIANNGQPRIGTGYWARGVGELLLIAKRGKPVRKADHPVVAGLMEEDLVFYGTRNKHSAKPMDVYNWIEATADGPYLELFGRQTRENWTTWGLDLGYELGSFGVRQFA